MFGHFARAARTAVRSGARRAQGALRSNVRTFASEGAADSGAAGALGSIAAMGALVVAGYTYNDSQQSARALQGQVNALERKIAGFTNSA